MSGKRTFQARTFKARTFASGTWAGTGPPPVLGSGCALRGQVFSPGAQSGQTFEAGVGRSSQDEPVGQTFSPGAQKGEVFC